MDSSTTPQGDPWKQWLLYRRNPTDESAARTHEGLKPIRDEVLENAHIQEGETVLDVGTGTGLIAFGALEKVGDAGRIIFSDISADCLEHCRAFATEMGASKQCEFLNIPVEDLAPVPDASVDVVTSRSVLIYSKEKQRAFHEFFRVLRPHGRVSMFEPINSFGFHARRLPNTFRGYEATPIAGIATKIEEAFDVHQPVEGSSMLDFDERDLIEFARAAGFTEVHLEYKAVITPARVADWDHFYRSAPNPLALTLEEAAQRALSEEERDTFVQYMRPKVENEFMTMQRAYAFLVAVRHE